MSMFMQMMTSSTGSSSRKNSSKTRRNNMKKMLDIEIPEHYLQQALEEAGEEPSVGMNTLQNTLIEGMIIPQLNLLLNYIQLKEELRRKTTENMKLKEKYGDKTVEKEHLDTKMMESDEKIVRENIEQSILLLKERKLSAKERPRSFLEQEKEDDHDNCKNTKSENSSNIRIKDETENNKLKDRVEINTKATQVYPKTDDSQKNESCGDNEGHKCGDNKNDGERNVLKKGDKVGNKICSLAKDFEKEGENLELPTPNIHYKSDRCSSANGLANHCSSSNDPTNRCSSSTDPTNRCLHDVCKLSDDESCGSLHDVITAFRLNSASPLIDNERYDSTLLKMLEDIEKKCEKSIDEYSKLSFIKAISELQKRVFVLNDKTKRLEKVVRKQQAYIDHCTQEEQLKQLTLLGISEEFPIVLDDIEYKSDWAKVNALFEHLDLDFRPERLYRLKQLEGQTVRPIVVQFNNYSDRAIARERLRSLPKGKQLKEIVLKEVIDRYNNLFF